MKKKKKKFAVVGDNVFPFCFLLGLDFIIQHNIDIDVNRKLCKIYGVSTCNLLPKPSQDQNDGVMLLDADASLSHQLSATVVGGDLRCSGPTICQLCVLQCYDVMLNLLREHQLVSG